MVYRFKPSEKNHAKREKKPYCRAGADSPRRLYGYRLENIDLSTLFELNKIEGEVKKGRSAAFLGALPSRLRAGLAFCVSVIKRSAKGLWHALSAAFLRLFGLACTITEKIRAKSRQRKLGDIAMLSGMLCAAVAVMLVSVLAVVYKLVISEYFGRYEKIIVPDMIGKSYEAVRDALDEEYYNITVSYAYDSSLPSGSVLSQYPSAGAERKIFSGGELCNLDIVVSRGKETREIMDLVGKSARNAALELKNAAFAVMEVGEFSPSVPSGNVISTSPSAGELLEVGGLVVLYVSRGKEASEMLVPDVCGISESDAIRKILASGFVVGNISYESSQQRAGIVISQEIEPRTSLGKGSEISFSVSAGQAFSDKKVPSLYGLTIEGAKERLAEYGLVCREVYSTESNEKKGTVIAQTPSAGSAITPSTVGVDIYVSS